MKSTIEQLTRQLFIINRLRREQGYLNTDALLDAIERACDIRSFTFPADRKSRMRLIQRDIRAIEDMFNVVIANKRGRGYYIAEDDDESRLLYDRFVSDFDLLTAVSPDADLHRYVLAERNRYVGSDNFLPLLNAIKKREVIEFQYTNIRKGTVSTHRVEPYFLKEDQMRWYLVAMKRGSMSLFGIERISGLTILDEHFKRDETIDGTGLFRDCFGIWDDPRAEAEEVILRYDALDGAFLKSVPLHPSQKIVTDNDMEFTISLKIKITNDFVMALLSRSRSLEVIKPLHLRERVRDIYLKASERNK